MSDRIIQAMHDKLDAEIQLSKLRPDVAKVLSGLLSVQSLPATYHDYQYAKRVLSTVAGRDCPKAEQYDIRQYDLALKCWCDSVGF